MQKSQSKSKKISRIKLQPGPLSSRIDVFLALGNIHRLHILEACARRPLTQAMINRHMGANMKFHVYELQRAGLLIKVEGESFIHNKSNLKLQYLIDAINICLAKD